MDQKTNLQIETEPAVPETEEGARQKEKKPFSQKSLQVLCAILCVFSVIVAILSSVIIVRGWINPDRPPSVFGITPAVMADDSMQSEAADAIAYGDAIFFKKTDGEDLENGEVFAFYEDGIIRVGRVQGLTQTEDGFLCYVKADNLPAPYATEITAENAVGTVAFKMHWLGVLALFVLTPIGKFLFIWLPLIVFASFLLYEWWLVRREAKMDAENAEAADTVETENSIPKGEL